MTYLVTGATGTVGALVADRLLDRGVRPRVFARDPAKARARFGDRVDVVAGDLADPDSLARAAGGVAAVFLVNSGPELDRHDAGAARACRTAGVGRLVKLSSLDAEHLVGTGVWHARGEAAIRDAGIEFAFVRPTGFATNALYWARTIKSEGAVRACTGDGRIPFVDPRDIADVAVAALTSPAHAGATLALTGPQAMSYAEMTAAIAQAIGRPLRFEAISEDDARRQQVAWGAPAAMVDARLSIFRAIREGRLAEVTATIARVLGRPPRRFEDWVRDNAAAFA